MRLSDDLRSSRAIYAKGILFLVLAFIAGGLLIAQSPDTKTVALLAICVWAACRSYYFAFYVIEKYVDSEFRFSGLIDFVKYLMRK